MAWQAADVDVTPFNPAAGTDGDFSGTAFELSSAVSQFGGLSGLAWDRDWLYFVSDRSALWRARAIFSNDGDIADLTDWQWTSVRIAGKPRQSLDLEAITIAADGTMFGAIEGYHKIYELKASADGIEAAPLDIPDILAPSPLNRGIEALATHDGRAFLALSEGLLREDGGHAAVVTDLDGTVQAISYPSPTGFDPTDAAWTADGKLIILERRYGLMSGWQTRIGEMQINDDAQKARRKDLVTFQPSLRLDNFEGLAIRDDERGVRATIISDDNFLFLQSTLLFDLKLPAD